MTFRSERDSFFTAFIWITVLILAGIILIPLAIADFFGNTQTTTVDIVIVCAILVFSVGSILWPTYSIKYVLYEDHLYVKGGPFRKRISYDEITKIAPTRNIWTGFRILSAKRAVEIFYKSAVFGSIKISPQERILFLEELKKHCPEAVIEWDE